MNNKEMALTIKLIREKNLLSQKEFAEKLGVSSQTVWYWEHALKRPRMENLRIIDKFRIMALEKQLEEEKKATELEKQKTRKKRAEQESRR